MGMCRFLLSLLVMAMVFTSCAMFETPQEPPDQAITKLPPKNQVYPLKEGLHLQVKFESDNAYDASQLGLFMMCKTEKREKVVGVEDAEFFPKYFSIINSNIDDGLLYISEKEATTFAQAAYLQYQTGVTSAADLHKYKKTRVLSEIVSLKKE